MIELKAAPTILVALPPWEPRMPPLGLACLTEFLRSCGKEVHPLDFNRLMFEAGQVAWRGGLGVQETTMTFTTGRHGALVDALIDALADSSAGVLGLSVAPLSVGLARQIAQRIKARRPRLVIIAGGPGVDLEHQRQQLWSGVAGVDYCVIGEGEITLADLLDRLEEDEAISPTPGVVPGPHLPQFTFEPRPPVDLERVPLPTFSDFDLDLYPSDSCGRCLPVQTSRGCPHRCAFCVDRSGAGPFRASSPEAIVDHLRYLEQNHQIDSVEFVDLVLNGSPKHLKRWCSQLSQQELMILWSAHCTITEEMDAETLMTMRLAGCKNICYGLESGSDRVLGAMGKDYTSATAAAVLRRSFEQGLKVSVNLMTGFPGETAADHAQTLELLRQSRFLSEVVTLSACRAQQELSRDPQAYGILPGGSNVGFLDRAGNTAETRSQRLNELISQLTTLGIPARQMVDASGPGQASRHLYREHCHAVKTGRLAAQTLTAGAIRLEVDNLENRILLFAGSQPLCEGDGLGAFLKVKDRYLDLRTSRWTTWSSEDGALNLEASLLYEPVTLQLRVSAAPGSGLDLQLDLHAERPVSLQDFHFGLFLAGSLQRYHTPAGSGPLRLGQPGDVAEACIVRAPTRLLMLTGEEGASSASLSFQPTDGFYLETRLIQDQRGRRLMFKRIWDFPSFGATQVLGDHPLLRVRIDAPPAASQAAADPRRVRGEEQTDFAVVICPPWQNDTAPLWPAMLASAARSYGFSGMCHDLNTLSYRRVKPQEREMWEMRNLFSWRKEESFETLWALIDESMDEGLQRILALQPRVVGFSLTEASIRCSLRLAQKTKAAAPETHIVFGGPGIYWTFDLDGVLAPSNMYDPWTKQPVGPAGLVDVYLRGEADVTFPLLLHCLIKGLDPLQVPGASLFADGAWRSGPPPVCPKDLDALPHPDFGDLYVPSYGSGYLPLLTSRGCIRSCAFCNDHKLQNTYRCRSAEHVMDELRDLHRRYKVDGLAILDLLLNGDLEQLGRLCDLMIESGTPFRWGGQALIQGKMDAALIEKMARAGCTELTFGLESLSQSVVDLMHKGFQVTHACQVMREARAAGIETSTNFLVGFPGETPEMFQETLDVLRNNQDAITRVQAINACHLTYRSRLWNHPERYGVQIDVPEYWYRWQGPFGNDYAERTRRVSELAALVVELGMSFSEQNLYDESEEDDEVLVVLPSF